MQHHKKPVKLKPVYIILGSLLPFTFLLSLPLLEKVGYANPGDVGFPKNYNGTVSYTVSGYISSAAATGGFGAVHFFTLLLMWEAPIHKS